MAAPTRVVIDDSITIDCSISERHTSVVELTRHPIEEGASPVDHAREQPERVQLDGLLTNTPLGPEERAARGLSEVEGRPGAPGVPGYAQEQFGKLRALKSARRAVTLKTAFRTYSNMVVVSLEVPRDAKTADAIRFSLVMESVRFVKSELARLDRVQKPQANPRKPVTKTDQTKKPGTPKPEEQRSLLKKFTDWTGATTPGSGVAP
ncbi:MAG: phage baseplate protein [Phycisphaerales bacterium]|nr:hypothetical protein [Chloroflexota bacterium]